MSDTPCLIDRLQQTWPPAQWSDVTLLAAVSGGADSVAMLRALHQIRLSGPGRLIVAHYNHRLRGEQSDLDEQFVRQLAGQLSLHIEVGAPTGETSMAEAETRRLRYEFLHSTAQQVGARYVATAHNANDQAETVLHRILRGTGIEGLAGIPRARQLSDEITLVRPMLEFSRQELSDYLQPLGQDFRHDDSNESVQWTRNRIRHQLMPHLKQAYNPQVEQALIRLAKLAEQTCHVVDQRVSQIVEQAVREVDETTIQIDRRQLQGVDLHVVRQLLITIWKQNDWPQQAMGFEQWDEVANLVAMPPAGDTTRRQLPGSMEVIRRGDLITVKRCVGSHAERAPCKPF